MGSRGPKPRIELDPALEQKVLDLIRAGNYIETAAAAAGINKKTIYSWLRNVKGFSDKMLEAQGAAEARDVALIAKAAIEHWQAAAWRLERKNPRKWGARVQVSVQQELAEVLQRIEGAVDEETYDRILRAIASEAGSGPAPATPGEEDSPDVH